jgi:hypothetical protein
VPAPTSPVPAACAADSFESGFNAGGASEPELDRLRITPARPAAGTAAALTRAPSPAAALPLPGVSWRGSASRSVCGGRVPSAAARAGSRHRALGFGLGPALLANELPAEEGKELLPSHPHFLSPPPMLTPRHDQGHPIDVPGSKLRGVLLPLTASIASSSGGRRLGRGRHAAVPAVPAAAVPAATAAGTVNATSIRRSTQSQSLVDPADVAPAIALEPEESGTLAPGRLRLQIGPGPAAQAGMPEPP